MPAAPSSMGSAGGGASVMGIGPGGITQQQLDLQAQSTSTSTSLHLLPSSASSTLLQRPTGLHTDRTPSFQRTNSANKVPQQQQTKRPRSSSIVSVQEIAENYDDSLDSGALTNVNADWVNYKGAWLIHVVLILVGIVLLDIVPGMTQDLAWTIVNLGYLSISYIMFHYVTGVPFDLSSNSGVYDRLTLWEQIDKGAQYTPAKKWLTTLPIVLFLMSTHYTRYDSHPALFTLNLLSLILVGLAPKLPYFHRLRFKFFDTTDGLQSGMITPDASNSAPATPIESNTESGRGFRFESNSS